MRAARGWKLLVRAAAMGICRCVETRFSGSGVAVLSLLKALHAASNKETGAKK
jgi:hypothetical protein